MDTLIQLPQFSYTELDFDSIVTLIQNLIQEHPEYNVNWDDFLESNAGRMIVEITSYIIEKLAARVDWNTQELYLSTATQSDSVIKLLRLINAKPTLPVGAKLNVTVTLANWSSPFQLGVRERLSIPDSTGTLVNFELIQNASDGKPDYNFQYTVPSGTIASPVYIIPNVPFYQGQTIEDDSFYADGVSNDSIVLQRTPVIQNSIRVFASQIVNGQQMWVECVEVESFISPEAQQNGVPASLKVIPYMTSINSSNGVTVNFGTDPIVKIPSKNQQFRVLYRVGGGANTNVVANALNLTKTYVVNNTRISTIFTNPYAGFGGTDAQDLVQLKLTAPLTLRTANKTVTIEDYITHLTTNTTISLMHVNVIGKENEPANFYAQHGYSLPPLDVWIYATPLRDNYSSNSPQYYTKIFKIERAWNDHGIVAYENFLLSTTVQTVFLKQLFKYKNYTKYITLFEGTNTMTGISFVEGIDYTIDYNTCMLSRISTANSGTMPDDSHTYRIQYVEDASATDHMNYCFFTFDAVSESVVLDHIPNSIYVQNPIMIHDNNYSSQYVQGTDFSVNYTTNTITRLSTGSITQGQQVIIEWSGQYNPTIETEDSDILSSIANKKMICVDNYVKDSIYSTFDLVGTVYCYKNTIENVKANLETYLRELYSLPNRTYAQTVNKSQLTADIMGYAGVRFVDVSYMGRNYNTYKMYINNVISQADLTALDCATYDYEIPCQYNEIFVVNDDAWDGPQIIDNQVSGFIFKYQEI
jgi:hypothetical protein